MRRREILTAALGLVGAACASKKPGADFGEPKSRYSMRGEVVRLKPENRIAVVKHEEIEGWMEAMTMEFPVPDPAEFAKLKRGKKITATVLVNDLHYWLADISLEP